jgi:ubiquinone/menaquinone biosynthesis C-methylase UbiE
MNETISWEEAVKRLRTIPEHADLVRDAYLDEDNIEAAKRFEASEEFKAVLSILRSNFKKPPPWEVLDIGAGNGVASYAFAKATHKVIALEPDPSNDVGAGAIRRLKNSLGLNIEILESPAEKIPLPDMAVDVVYVRQALHHANDLKKLLREVSRVLRGGGYLLVTREHVVNNEEQLKQFLMSHPLHKWYGGEHAYTLKQYTNSIEDAGLRLVRVLGVYESVINYAPMSKKKFKDAVGERFKSFGIARMLKIAFKNKLIWRWFAWLFTRIDRSPGRLYSFIAIKPLRNNL